jgi:hypothetical protein
MFLKLNILKKVVLDKKNFWKHHFQFLLLLKVLLVHFIDILFYLKLCSGVFKCLVQVLSLRMFCLEEGDGGMGLNYLIMLCFVNKRL